MRKLIHSVKSSYPQRRVQKELSHARIASILGGTIATRKRVTVSFARMERFGAVQVMLDLNFCEKIEADAMTLIPGDLVLDYDNVGILLVTRVGTRQR